MDVEQYHRDCIRKIADHARREAQYHIDALVRLESLKPPKPMVVSIDVDGNPMISLREIMERSGMEIDEQRYNEAFERCEKPVTDPHEPR